MRQGNFNLGLTYFIDPPVPVTELSLQALPKAQSLTPEAIHVYVLNFNDFLIQAPSLQIYLTATEREHVAQLVTKTLRTRSLIAKAATRLLLGHYLGLAPKKVPLVRKDLTKPTLSSPFNNYQFNLAHSDSYFAFVITLKSSIGIDIEGMHSKTDYLALSARFFHPEEHQTLLRSVAPEALFFRLWTQKEAWVKMNGRGLSFGLDRFAIDPHSAKLLWVDEPNYCLETVFGMSFALMEQHYASVMSQKPLDAIALFQLNSGSV